MPKRKPFAHAAKWSAGWYAIGKGICSGPWDTESEAMIVVDKWNDATEMGN